MLVENEEQLAALREGGKRLARAMGEIAGMVAPGVSTLELEERARELLSKDDDRAAFLNYKPEGAARPYPAALCASVNDAVVHGIPNEDPYTFKEGDIVTLDMGLVHSGLVTDMAVTVSVGTIDEEASRLIEAAREALSSALAAAKVGNTTGDIGHAVEETAKKYGFNVPKELGGHGVGKRVHEQPFVPNFGTQGSGAKLEENMVLAIEPIIISGSGDIVLDGDGYTYKTRDGSRAAQFEHTVLITKGKAGILTADE